MINLTRTIRPVGIFAVFTVEDFEPVGGETGADLHRHQDFRCVGLRNIKIPRRTDFVARFSENDFGDIEIHYGIDDDCSRGGKRDCVAYS